MIICQCLCKKALITFVLYQHTGLDFMAVFGKIFGVHRQMVNCAKELQENDCTNYSEMYFKIKLKDMITENYGSFLLQVTFQFCPDLETSWQP